MGITGGRTTRFCGHPTLRRVCGGSRLTKPDASSEPGNDPDRNGTGVGETQRCCNPLGQRRRYGLPVRSGQLPGGQGHHVEVEPDLPGLVVFGAVLAVANIESVVDVMAITEITQS